MIVENRPGAGGAVGMEAVAHAAPDGYTLGAINTGDIIGGFLHTQPVVRPVQGPVADRDVRRSATIAGRERTRSRQTFQEFLAYARANPGKINYGSAGTGSLTQIGAEQLARLAGLQLVHVPYRGAIPAVTDMIAGRVQMMHISLNPTYAHIKAGTLRPLAVTVKDRWTDYLPDVPTTAEAGLPEYEMDIWFGLVGPRGMPKPIVDQINGYMRSMVADPVMKQAIDRWFHAAAVEKRGRIRGLSGAGCAALAADRP